MSKSKEKNSYSLNRTWWDWSFDNQSKVKPHHGILYMWAIEQNNRCGWVDEFGFPSAHAMKCTGIRSWKTYSNTLNDLIDWGFIDMRERSKNQFTANIIHLVHNSQEPSKTLDVSRLNEMDINESACVLETKANESAYALDVKATTKASPKQLPKQVEYIKQVNKETSKKVKDVSVDTSGMDLIELSEYNRKIALEKRANANKSSIQYTDIFEKLWDSNPSTREVKRSGVNLKQRVGLIYNTIAKRVTDKKDTAKIIYNASVDIEENYKSYTHYNFTQTISDGIKLAFGGNRYQTQSLQNYITNGIKLKEAEISNRFE